MAAPSVPLPLLLTAAAVLGAVSLLTWRHHRRHRWTPVGTLAAINLYPLKSGVGVRCRHAQVTRLGVRHAGVLDRCLALVCEGKVLNANSRRRLVLIAADVSAADVTLTAPGMPPLTAPLPREGDDVRLLHVDLSELPDSGVDLGPDVARWMADFFADGKTYALIYFLLGTVKPRRTVDLPRPHAHLGAPGDVMTYNFVTPVSAICAASLDALNSRLDEPVTLDHFRHNLVVSGAPAFDDDTWLRVRVGGAELRRTKPVHRCGITLVDPRTAERSAAMEPLRTLRTFRLARTAEERRIYKEAPLIGSALAVDEEGEVAVGDTVYVMRK